MVQTHFGTVRIGFNPPMTFGPRGGVVGAVLMLGTSVSSEEDFP